MFIFMLLHQTYRLMINSMLKPIMDEFGIDESQMGFVMSGSARRSSSGSPLSSGDRSSG
jgi:predicted MFS family arabinose efflux permease